MPSTLGLLELVSFDNSFHYPIPSFKAYPSKTLQIFKAFKNTDSLQSWKDSTSQGYRHILLGLANWFFKIELFSVIEVFSAWNLQVLLINVSFSIAQITSPPRPNSGNLVLFIQMSKTKYCVYDGMKYKW